jgi:hypothetical protein
MTNIGRFDDRRRPSPPHLASGGKPPQAASLNGSRKRSTAFQANEIFGDSIQWNFVFVWRAGVWKNPAKRVQAHIN